MALGQRATQLVLGYTVPLIAAIVASVQMYSSLTGTLSPWKGGGFGMFSTFDDPNKRTIRLAVVDPEGKTYRIDSGTDQAALINQRDRSRIRTQPQLRHLQALTDELLARTYVPSPNVPPADGSSGMARMKPEHGPSAAVAHPAPRAGRAEYSFRPIAVEVAVLRLRLDPRGWELKLEMLLNGRDGGVGR